MDKVGAVYQKLKGRAQKKLGKFHLNKGYVVKGGIASAEGTFNESISNAKLKAGGKIRTREELLEEDDFFI